MMDILGFKVEDALAELKSLKGEDSVRIVETSGYKGSQDISAYSDVRVVGIRESESETLLIVAKF